MAALQFPIYLDNHATTRVDDRVMAAMIPYFVEHYGNAASRQHEFGWRAEGAVEKARRDVAHLLGAEEGEVYFTSGATEANNLVLKGMIEAYAPEKTHVITVATEHQSVLDTCARLEDFGYSVTRLGVDAHGLVDPDAIRKAITSRTLLVSVMMGNNEIGTIPDVTAVGLVCREAGVFFHTDASQATGYVPIDVDASGIDALVMSGHKIHGPKGVGALFLKKGVQVSPQMEGGGHERGKRSGTLNVPGIVGLGVASRLVLEERQEYLPRVERLRTMFVDLLRGQSGDVSINGHPRFRLPNNVSATFHGIRADRLILEVRRVAMSTGSACSSASPEPSHVLRAIGLDREAVNSTMRFGLSRLTTEEEIVSAAEFVAEGVRTVRAKTLAVEVKA